MTLRFSNNAFGVLDSGISSSSTTIVLSTGDGGKFPILGPGDSFYATLVDQGNNLEIVLVTARASDTLVVSRGRDGTTARAYQAGDRLMHRVTAATLNGFAQTDDLGGAAFRDIGSGPNDIPSNNGLGSAAFRDVGTGSGDVIDLGGLSAFAAGGTGLPRVSVQALDPPTPGSGIVGYVDNTSASTFRGQGDTSVSTSEHWSSSVYLVLVGGTVTFSCSASVTTAVQSGNGWASAYLELLKNGVRVAARSIPQNSALTTSASGALSADVSVAAGDVLSVHAFAQAKGTSQNQTSVSARASTDSMPIVTSGSGQFVGLTVPDEVFP